MNPRYVIDLSYETNHRDVRRLRGGRACATGAPGGGPLLRRMGSRPFSDADSTGLPRLPVQGSPRGCLVGSFPNRAAPNSDWWKVEARRTVTHANYYVSKRFNSVTLATHFLEHNWAKYLTGNQRARVCAPLGTNRNAEKKNG